MSFIKIERMDGFEDVDAIRGIFGSSARVEEIITGQCFPHVKKWEGEWARAGSESWYSVANISTGFFRYQIPVAIKAIVSMGGDISGRALREANRLEKLYPHAPIVYALAPGTIVKEWLIPDDPDDQDEQLWSDLKSFLSQVGIYFLDKQIQSLALINNGRAKIFDAGWDIKD